MVRILSKEEFMELALKNEELKKKRKVVEYLLKKSANYDNQNDNEEG